MTDGPYDYAAERWDARNHSKSDVRWVAGTAYDEADVPDEADA